MKVFHRIILAIGISAVGLVSGCESSVPPVKSVLPYYNEASFTPQWYASESEIPEGFHKIPSFDLMDQEGQSITETTFDGKLYVANFFFTACPGICPMTMSNMARLQKEFEGDDGIVLVSHSVTPEQDSVGALQAFAEKMQALSSKWYLLTGKRDQIYDLGKNFYFAEEDLGEVNAEISRQEAFLHTESFFLIDKDRHIRGVYNGMNTASVSQLIADIRLLQGRML